MQWNASWIWLGSDEPAENVYAYARRELRLDAAPAKASLSITACSLYKLYINGKPVGRGPNPSDPSRYYYDVYDVGHLLRAGANVIAVACHNYSPTSRGIIGQNWGPGALLVELRTGDGRPLLVSDASWRIVRPPEWDPAAPMNCTLYGDYKEVLDTRLEPPGWMEAGFDDSAWAPARVLGRPPMDPFSTLVEREIPMLVGEEVHPVNAYWESASVTYAWRDDWEVYHEQRLIPGDYPADGKRPRAMMTHDDFAPSILLDYGQLVTGYPRIGIADSGGGVLDVLYGEQLHLTRVDRFVLRGGRQVLEPFNRRTFRYMKLLFPQTPRPIEFDGVWMNNDTYPVEPRGAFRCNDELLNRIWDVGAYTMRLSMLDHFCDCPWRERTIYGGDVYPENLIAYYAFGDPRLAAKTLRQMFALQHEDGGLPPYGPYRGAHTFYPAWSAYLGLSLIDLYELSADRTLLDELWSGLVRLCDWTIAQCQANEHYMIGSPAQAMEPGEWARAKKVRFTPWEAIPFAVLLKRCAGLAQRLGRPAEAQRFADAAQRASQAIHRLLVDPASGLARPGVRSSDLPGEYDNGLLLWSGLAEPRHASELARRLAGQGLRRMNSPFHGFFTLEGMFDCGADDSGLALVRRYWGEMIRRGATTFWEHFSLDWPADRAPDRGLSLCHGWSAAPTYSLPAHVLGVRPTSPGFGEALVAPHPGDLDWASGTVPTPAGPILVHWQRTSTRFEMQLQIPDGCTARVVLPAPAGRDAPSRVIDRVRPGRHVLSH